MWLCFWDLSKLVSDDEKHVSEDSLLHETCETAVLAESVGEVGYIDPEPEVCHAVSIVDYFKDN